MSRGTENAVMNRVLQGFLSCGIADGRRMSRGIAAFVLLVAILPTPVFAFAQSHAVVTPDQLAWRPLIPGVEMAVVSGDPDKKGGLYVIRIRSNGEVRVPPHWHPTDEHVTVLAGSFWMARGERYDPSKLIELKPGSHSVMPATMPHFGLHKAGMSSKCTEKGPLPPLS
jgi:mannose-6-phosphate isomerase-like protein (cupin superfamily)